MQISDVIAKLSRAVSVEPPRTIGYCDPAILIKDADLSFLMKQKNAAPAQSGYDGEANMDRLDPADCLPSSRPSDGPSV